MHCDLDSAKNQFFDFIKVNLYLVTTVVGTNILAGIEFHVREVYKYQYPIANSGITVIVLCIDSDEALIKVTHVRLPCYLILLCQSSAIDIQSAETGQPDA
jgi:hypothetical protein